MGRRPTVRRIFRASCRLLLLVWLVAASAAPAVGYAAAGPSTATAVAPGGPPASPGNPLATLPDPQGAARPTSGLPRAAGPQAAGPGAGPGAEPSFNLVAGDEYWSALGAGANNGVRSLTVDPSGNVYAGGWFTSTAGVANTSHIAKWDGRAWSALGTGMSGVGETLVFAQAFSGGNLYAGGLFTDAGRKANTAKIAKWDPATYTWSALGSGVNDTVLNLALDVDPPQASGNLYAGGRFSSAGGVANTSYIAKWDGASWSALGRGGVGMLGGDVRALALDGQGNPYAGGNFTTAGGVSASRIARWDGSQWSALGSGMNGIVDALAFDASRNLLYAGGRFGSAGGVGANRIARWNGSQWSALGSGVNWSVTALALDPPQAGGVLYAGGGFQTAGERSANYVAKWDGSRWSALGSGMNYWVYTLAFSGGVLYAGGSFRDAGGDPNADYIAKWDGTSWSALGRGVGSTVNAPLLFAQIVYHATLNIGGRHRPVSPSQP